MTLQGTADLQVRPDHRRPLRTWTSAVLEGHL